MLNPPQIPVNKKNFKLGLLCNLELKAQMDKPKIKQLMILADKVAIGKDNVDLENAIPKKYRITLPIPPPKNTHNAAILLFS